MYVKAHVHESTQATQTGTEERGQKYTDAVGRLA